MTTRCQKKSYIDIRNERTIVGAKLITQFKLPKLSDQMRVSEDEQPMKT